MKRNGFSSQLLEKTFSPSHKLGETLFSPTKHKREMENNSPSSNLHQKPIASQQWRENYSSPFAKPFLQMMIVTCQSEFGYLLSSM